LKSQLFIQENLNKEEIKMDVLARMVGTLVADSLKADEEMREMMDINSKDTMDVNNNTKGEWGYTESLFSPQSAPC